MDYNTLLDMASDLGYYLAMSGAETFRVEDSISRILAAYGQKCDVFSIPNCLIVSIETEDGQSITRMRRIGFHGNDLDSVERFSNLSRRICIERPEPQIAMEWLKEVAASRVNYKLPIHLLGNFLGAAGFGWFYGCNLPETFLAGLCGILVGLVIYLLDSLKVNNFFTTLMAAFIMSFVVYCGAGLELLTNPDSTIIGVLMLLGPGLLFTNALRDIIFGDTNSGVNRIVQVILIAVAIALGTGFALRFATGLCGALPESIANAYPDWITALASFVGCVGFSILFNVHGRGGILCALGGGLTWVTYCICYHHTNDVVMSNLVGAIFSSAYAEIMARIRKYPAISYLVISLFPLLPGAGIYYATNSFVKGDMDTFASTGTQTIAVAGAWAIGMLIVSTTVRLWGVWKQRKK